MTETRQDRDLRCGADFPYDGPRPEQDWAHRASRAICYDLCDRGGIKHEMALVDSEIRPEIVDAIAAIIRRAAETKENDR
jgi:hypothetical protein